MTRVTFVMMVAAERIPVMVPVATVAGIGKDHVFMLIITDPAAAARRLRQILRLAAQAASRTGFDRLLRRFGRFCLCRHISSLLGTAELKQQYGTYHGIRARPAVCLLGQPQGHTHIFWVKGVTHFFRYNILLLLVYTVQISYLEFRTILDYCNILLCAS